METAAEWIEDPPTDSSPAHNANWKNVHYLMTLYRLCARLAATFLCNLMIGLMQDVKWQTYGETFVSFWQMCVNFAGRCTGSNFTSPEVPLDVCFCIRAFMHAYNPVQSAQSKNLKFFLAHQISTTPLPIRSHFYPTKSNVI